MALLLGATLAAGCRVVVDTRVEPDGSGELRSAIVFSDEESRAFAQSPGNEPRSICDDLRGDLPDGAEFIEGERGGETHCTTVRPFRDLADLRSLYEAMGGVTVRELKFELGRLVFDVEVALSGPRQGQGEPVDQEWRLNLPGAVLSHNAQRVEGGTLVWEGTAGQKLAMRAESRVGIGPKTLGLSGAAILAALAGLTLVAVVLLTRRRTGRQAA